MFGSLALKLDVAPLTETARRLGVPFEAIGEDVAAILRRGAAAQFSAGASFDGATVTNWPASRRFGNEPAGRPMVKSGALERAWTGGAGSFTEVRPKSVVIGVSSPDWVAVFQTEEPSVVKPVSAAQRNAIGARTGVWLTSEQMFEGITVAPRPIGISDADVGQVADLLVNSVAGGDFVEGGDSGEAVSE